MPYEWNDAKLQKDHERHLRLWPHRSLPRRGFAGFILLTFGLLMIPLYPLLGTVILWGVLPFLMLSLAAIWFALERSYRDAKLTEYLVIGPENVHLERVEANGRTQAWECQTYWARANMHATAGPVAHYVTLSGKGREVEIGAFLTEDERKLLFGELSDALRGAVGARGL